MKIAKFFILGLFGYLVFAETGWADTNPQHIQVLDGAMGSTDAFMKEQSLQRAEQRELTADQVNFQEKFSQLQEPNDPIPKPGALPCAKKHKSAKTPSNPLSPHLGESPMR
jgi:hypothetical protein